MTEREWKRVVAEMIARWPHSEVPDSTVAVWFSDVADLEAEHVLIALRSYSRDGREFPPTGGMLRAKVVELQRDDPDHAEAYALVMAAIKRHGEDADALDWLRERSSAASTALQRYGIQAFRFEPTEDGTRRAQFRDCFRGVVAERQRVGVYSGLPRIEKGEPKQIAQAHYGGTLHAAHSSPSGQNA